MEMILKYLLAFLVGGCFCVIAQIIIDKTKITPARTLVIYVCTGVFLSAIGLYSPLIDLAGAGASVPLTGFGHLIATGIKEAVEEKGLLGALTGGLSAASAGIAAVLCFSFIAALVSRGRPK